MISRLRTMFNRFHENPRTFIDITKYGHEQYQDIIINNEIIKKATRNRAESELRFRIIQDILDRYMRPFTMLDIGASQGYYSFRTAHNYDCVCVMIEGDNAHYPKVGRQLLDLCKANTSLENIILLNKHITLPDLKRLSECESFDVVLALNIIHWFGDRWQQVADAVLAMGDKIIIETPPLENFATVNKILPENQYRTTFHTAVLKLLQKCRATPPTTHPSYTFLKLKKRHSTENNG